jgi:hypothetical protein
LQANKVKSLSDTAPSRLAQHALRLVDPNYPKPSISYQREVPTGSTRGVKDDAAWRTLREQATDPPLLGVVGILLP